MQIEATREAESTIGTIANALFEVEQSVESRETVEFKRYRIMIEHGIEGGYEYRVAEGRTTSHTRTLPSTYPSRMGKYDDRSGVETLEDFAKGLSGDAWNNLQDTRIIKALQDACSELAAAPDFAHRLNRAVNHALAVRKGIALPHGEEL